MGTETLLQRPPAGIIRGTHKSTYAHQIFVEDNTFVQFTAYAYVVPRAYRVYKPLVIPIEGYVVTHDVLFVIVGI